MRTYLKETANWLLDLAYPGDWKPYVIREDGVYVCDEHRAASPPDEAFDWTPAYDMRWEGAPHPKTAPMLAIPFTAAELAAFMLDGAGVLISEALECPLGGDIQASPRLPTSAGDYVERQALIEAYAAAAQAIDRVGKFDHVQQARAYELEEQAQQARSAALRKEGVYFQNQADAEYEERRKRVLETVAPQLDAARDAVEESKQKWLAWRRAMVQELLGPAVEGEASKTDAVKPIPRSEAQERAMLAAIREAGHDPKALPPTAPGKRGVKAEVRQRLEGKNLLFVRGSRVFDKCWQRLRGSEEIIDAS